ncbi:alpha/beta-hydrolase [Penicillium brevicompactum]|uniref:Alpha/beta-hydrolase n=1 Tax=Penicillium brevicompactum TaxID=5074 RepID=A0A9W9R019_PENBR|nr:alpha/beta-hydrolase [Penicillium brevicompactum]KAJ5361124.1 alpha/beta-hydrolase [Penicillium brevicompactum]
MTFPPSRIIEPEGIHTHTVILLHGRGSNGHDFADEFLAAHTSECQTLIESLPNVRWVLPTSRLRHSTVFDEEMRTWFDASSLDDIQQDQELQVQGLKESVCYVLSILDEELELLDGCCDRIFLGGISQGMATALWALLCAPGRIDAPLAGLLVFCGWLPFAHQAEAMMKQLDPQLDTLQRKRLVSEFFRNVISDPALTPPHPTDNLSVLSTPVFLSHGIDDPYVSVNLGRQAARVLEGIDIEVEGHEFMGADADGHWVKEPTGFDQILRFIQRHCLQ